MNSSVNCFVARDHQPGDPPRQWLNAFWDPTEMQMVYGQEGPGQRDVHVAVHRPGRRRHEMFHGVTDATSRLAYMFQSGALNESYSDIFGIIIANFTNPNILTWTWEIGAGSGTTAPPSATCPTPGSSVSPTGWPISRSFPNTRNGDSGGVHSNSGIHNKAAFNVMTSVDGRAGRSSPPNRSADLHLALTQQLSPTSQFSDSRRAVIIEPRSLLRNLPSADVTGRIDAIGKAYDAVGIK